MRATLVLVADPDAVPAVVTMAPSSLDEAPRFRVYIGDALALVLDEGTAEALADSLVEALATAADPPVLLWPGR